MNDVSQALFDCAWTESVPRDHLSSHWQHYGAETTVDLLADGTPALKAAGFDTLTRCGVHSRSLHWIERVSYARVTSRLRNYPRTWKAAKVLAGDLNGNLTFPVFKAAAVLAVLKDHWDQQRLSPQAFALIGDGSGFLAALILRDLPAARLYCIDFPKMLMFQARTVQAAAPQAGLSFRSSSTGLSPARCCLVLPWEAESINERIDCGINIASMQEMTVNAIRAYFDFLRRRSGPESRFYCVNRERKEMRGGGDHDVRRVPVASRRSSFCRWSLSLLHTLARLDNVRRRPSICWCTGAVRQLFRRSAQTSASETRGRAVEVRHQSVTPVLE